MYVDMIYTQLVQAGSGILGVLGVSGSGKSSLLAALAWHPGRHRVTGADAVGNG